MDDAKNRTPSTVTALMVQAIDEGKKLKKTLRNDDSYENLQRQCYRVIAILETLEKEINNGRG